jgi:hypothetical protein
MNKAKEISALWEQIKPQIDEMVHLCYEVEDHAEVTADAYQRGYENGFIAGHLKAEKSGQSFYEDGYQCGLNDAWLAARKICLEEPDGGMQLLVINDIFNVSNYRDALKDYSASEAIEKIRAYEQDKEEQIQVGDEVENTQTGARFIVTHMWVNNHGEKGVSGFNYECSAFSTALDLVRKTGRHFPEIAEVLRKMMEE